MPKVLVCASTMIHIKNFHLPYLRFFKEQGWDVHVAVPRSEPVPFVDRIIEIPMAKSIVSPRNVSAVLGMRRIIKQDKYDIIMSHAALAGIIARAGVLTAGKKTSKVIHTSHGYFFWKGCSPLRKIVYYTPERLLRRVTDCVVTMNQEDYLASQLLVRKGGLAVKVPGMGVDDSRFVPADAERRSAARRTLGIPDDAYVLVYAAEFSKRKNHSELLRALGRIKKSAPGVLLLLCGTGKLRCDIEAEAAGLGLVDNIRFLGWCGRMEDVYAACDLAVSTSTCEGLPFNVMEAQLSGLPVAASRIRGHTDLIEDGLTGYLYEPGDTEMLADLVLGLIRDCDRGKRLGLAARQSAQRFTLDKAYAGNTAVYRQIMH